MFNMNMNIISLLVLTQMKSEGSLMLFLKCTVTTVKAVPYGCHGLLCVDESKTKEINYSEESA